MDPDVIEAARLILSKLAQEKTQGPTMGELWESYFSCDGRFLKSSRTVDYSWRLLCRVKCKDGLSLGQRDAMSITSDIVEEMRCGLAASPFTGRPMRPATRNRNLYLIHRLLNWAAKNKKIPHVPIAPVRMEAEYNRRQTLLRTDDEFSRLMSCIKHETLKVFSLVLFDSGMRFGEAIQIRRVQFIRRLSGGGSIQLTADQTKTARGRTVYLTRRACDAIETLPNRGQYLFANEDGKPFSYVYFRHLLEDAVDRARIPTVPGQSIRFHQFRHAFVARAHRLFRWPQSRIMKQTGHTTTHIFTRYGDADDDEMAAWMDEMDSALERERLGPQSSRAEFPFENRQPAKFSR